MKKKVKKKLKKVDWKAINSWGPSPTVQETLP
jgi:hypothetical protein